MNFVVYPSVDISGGRCVRPLHGRFGSETVYSDDPSEIVVAFCRAGARCVHVVDLDGARSGEPVNRDVLLDVIARSRCPVQAGGAVITLDDIEQVIAAGAQRVVVSAAALEDPGALRRACARYPERVAASLAAREGDDATVTVAGGAPLEDVVSAFAEAGVAQLNYTDVTRDGTMRGPDVDAVARVASMTDVPVVVAGGISSLDDLRSVAALAGDGVRGAVVGRALYKGKFSLREAMLAADAAASGDDEAELERGR